MDGLDWSHLQTWSTMAPGCTLWRKLVDHVTTWAPSRSVRKVEVDLSRSPGHSLKKSASKRSLSIRWIYFCLLYITFPVPWCGAIEHKYVGKSHTVLSPPILRLLLTLFGNWVCELFLTRDIRLKVMREVVMQCRTVGVLSHTGIIRPPCSCGTIVVVHT